MKREMRRKMVMVLRKVVMVLRKMRYSKLEISRLCQRWVMLEAL